MSEQLLREALRALENPDELDELNRSIVDVSVSNIRAALAQPAEGGEVPLGAILNGREYARRLTEVYNFRDNLLHPLSGAMEWDELLRCFEHLAEDAQRTAPPANQEQAACRSDGRCQYADGAEVAAYRLRDEEASTHYGKDVYVYWSKDEFRDHPDKPKLLALLEPLYAAPPANQEQKCAQCQKPYKHGTNKAGCPKCAPGVRIAEVEFQKPLHASQEQAERAKGG